jgi:hypothetical protein
MLGLQRGVVKTVPGDVSRYRRRVMGSDGSGVPSPGAMARGIRDPAPGKENAELLREYPPSAAADGRTRIRQYPPGSTLALRSNRGISQGSDDSRRGLEVPSGCHPDHQSDRPSAAAETALGLAAAPVPQPHSGPVRPSWSAHGPHRKSPPETHWPSPQGGLPSALRRSLPPANNDWLMKALAGSRTVPRSGA